MNDRDMRLVAGFASGLGLLKAKEELHEGATLSADEVAGIIWGIKNLRAAGDRRESTKRPA
jgi:hypothetical protein